MTKQISPLRQRMLDDVAFRNMSPATQKCYTHAVACFARYHRTSTNKLGIEHVREYRLHLLFRGLKARRIVRRMTARCRDCCCALPLRGRLLR